jgi:hypothetical protein
MIIIINQGEHTGLTVAVSINYKHALRGISMHRMPAVIASCAYTSTTEGGRPAHLDSLTITTNLHFPTLSTGITIHETSRRP